MNAKQVLKECRLFTGLRDIDLEKIAGMTTEKKYDAGITMFSVESNADELYIIDEGRVAIQMSLPKSGGQAARRITVDVVSKNEIVGWSAIVEPYKYTFDALCMQTTIALSINGGRLREFLQGNSEVGFEVMKGLAKILAAGLNDTRQILIAERQFTLE